MSEAEENRRFILELESVSAPAVAPHELIRDGRVGIWSDEISSVQILSTDKQKPAPLPFASGKATYPSYDLLDGFGGRGGYSISAGTQHPQEAWAKQSTRRSRRTSASPRDWPRLRR